MPTHTANSCPTARALAAIKAIDDIRLKQREEYNRLTVLGDTLAFEADQP
jgi:hypothetical protein